MSGENLIFCDGEEIEFEDLDINNHYDVIEVDYCSTAMLPTLDSMTDRLIVREFNETFREIKQDLKFSNPARVLEVNAMNALCLKNLFAHREKIILSYEALQVFFQDNVTLCIGDFSRFKNSVVELHYCGGHLQPLVMILVHWVKELYVNDRQVNVEVLHPCNVVDTNIRSLCQILWQKRRPLVEPFLGRDVTGIVGEYLW